MLGGSDMLDKAQIEKSVLYPAFLLLGSKKRSEEERNDMDLLTSKIKWFCAFYYIAWRI